SEYHFSYILDNNFFEKYNLNQFTDSATSIQIDLIKNTHLFNVKIVIETNLKVTCDRCCNNLNVAILEAFNHVIKQVNNPLEFSEFESEPEITYVGFSDSELIFDDTIAEYLHIAFPNSTLCNEYGFECNTDMLKLIDDMAPKITTSQPFAEKLNSLY
ncbi:MAG: hypothetical protein ORN85_10195, partial [Sediminibacterium sp.]|nr:hypothetical protein [Sediminibacterium sp.]